MTDEPKPIEMLTPQEAGARLNEMAVQYTGGSADTPTTPEQAGAKLEKLYNTPEWRNKLEAGHSATRNEWEALRDLKRQSTTTREIAEGRAVAPLFETTEPGGLSTQNKIASADWLREIGIPPAGIEHIIESLQPGTKSHFSAADVSWARVNRERLMQDGAWIDRLLKGDIYARHALIGLNAILVAGAGDEK